MKSTLRFGQVLAVGLGLVALVAGSAAIAVAQGKPKGMQLKNADLRKMFGGGAAIEFRRADGSYEGKVVFNPDGSADRKFRPIGSKTYVETKGTWKIKGDTFCTSYAERGEECRTHYQVAGNTYDEWLANGMQSISYKLSK